LSLRCLTGCLHPDHAGFFDTPAQYLQWYWQHGAVQDAAAPTVAVLLYRKHVITQQMYIEQLIRCLEAKGIRPIPIFINGAVNADGLLCGEVPSSTAPARLTIASPLKVSPTPTCLQVWKRTPSYGIS
jgi:cobalamin biosynthesis Mg chelatase CobN